MVIVGDGDEALAKARLLGQSSARLRIVAEAPNPGFSPGSPQMAPSISRRPIIRLTSPAQCWCSPRPATRRWIVGFPTMPARKKFRSTRSTGRNSAISSRRRWSTARRSPSPSVPKARGRCSPRSCAQRSTGCCRLRSARLRCLPNSFRDAAERLLPKGNERRRFWNDFFTGAPARAMEIGHASEARQAASELLAAQRAVARPHRAGRRRAGRGRSADAARPSPADGSRRHRPRRAGAGGSRRHGPPRRREAACRKAQGLPFQEPGRDQCVCWSGSAAKASASYG